jgi:site-specific DNA-methyltransferase (adenine-specific)
MDLMKEFPDKHFELAIVDPPYGIGFAGFEKHYEGGKAKAKTTLHKPFAGNDLNSPDIEYFQQIFRVSKNQIIFGANHFISKIPFDSSCWIVWDKINGENPFADCELAWTSFKSAVRKFDFKWQGMIQGDMKNKEERIHPTQKPVALYKWLLEHYAKKGDKILDTHLGSMSSVIACYDEKFDITGAELDPDYFNAGTERVKKHTSQVRLDDLI